MKRILHIIPYTSLYPPKNGGQLRCFHLMDELSKYFLLDVVIFQKSRDIEEAGYHNNNVTFYSSEDTNNKNVVQKIIPTKIYNAIKYRIITKSIKGPANSTVLGLYPIIKKLRNNKYNFVVFEHLASMMLSKSIKHLFPSAKLILDAHNVDHILYKQEQDSFPDKVSDRTIKNTRYYEANLSKYVNLVFACSQSDLDVFNKINSNKIKGFIVPNGVDTKSKKFMLKKEINQTLIFCGDLRTEANKSGLLWFFNNIWKDLKKNKPMIKLLVIGKGHENTRLNEIKEDNSIIFTGFVESLDTYYEKASVSIVPLNIGSGTRLKILESMSYGLPVVSTPIGAEGVNYPKPTIVIAENASCFTNSVVSLLGDEKKYNEMRESANKFIKENFDWQVIAKKSYRYLNSL